MANCLSDLCTDNYNSLVPNNFELFLKLFSMAMCKVSTSRICQKKGLMMMSMRCGEIETMLLLLLFKFSKFYPGLRRLESDDWYVAVDRFICILVRKFHKIEQIFEILSNNGYWIVIGIVDWISVTLKL